MSFYQNNMLLSAVVKQVGPVMNIFLAISKFLSKSILRLKSSVSNYFSAHKYN